MAVKTKVGGFCATATLLDNAPNSRNARASRFMEPPLFVQRFYGFRSERRKVTRLRADSKRCQTPSPVCESGTYSARLVADPHMGNRRETDLAISLVALEHGDEGGQHA